MSLSQSDISLCKFSPLRTPAVKSSRSKYSVFECVSEAESTLSVVTRDIHNLAKSVGRKLNEVSDSDNILSDLDTNILMSKLQKKTTRPMAKKGKRDSSDDSSDSSTSETKEPIPSKNMNKQDKAGINGKQSPGKQKRRVSLSSLSSDPSDSDSSIDDKPKTGTGKGDNSGNNNSSLSRLSESDHGSNSKSKMLKGSNSEDKKPPSKLSIKGGKSKQSVKRARSVSSSSGEESESILKSPRKKLKIKQEPVETKSIPANSDDSSSVSSDTDSDVSSVIAVKSTSGSQGTKNEEKNKSLSEVDQLFQGSDRDSSPEPTPTKKQAQSVKTSSASPTLSAKFNGYKVPDSFTVDKSDESLTCNDIKGKQLWLIMAPDDIDINSLHGLKINMAGLSNISVDTEEDEKQYEVNIQPYDNEKMKTFNSVTLKASGTQEYVVGNEISGQIQVMNWIPTYPPVQLTKFKPAHHSVPDDLPYKLKPFGSESPARETDNTVDDIGVDKPHKHKKKKKKKDKSKSKH